ncbi:MAG: hypothetical protein ACR652_20080 [Methylocystis sp.]|uniref:hypothetical protein n=1 Tax=Methylocystis sp. TaxID=1911079 RepID=UPI003DA24F5D
MKEDGSEQDRRTIEIIESIASQVRAASSGILLAIRTPTRSLENVSYNKEAGDLEPGNKEQVRALTVNTARAFAQTLRLMAASRAMVARNDFATKREAYYISKNWGDCRFDEQAQSDAIMDDIEAIASLHGLSRENLRFYPESHGGSVAGLLVRAPQPAKQSKLTAPGSASSPTASPARLGISPSGRKRASFAIETDGMFQRLNNHRFWERAQCILVEMGRVPTGATRRFIRLLSARHDAAGLLLCRLRPIRLHQHLPYAEGRLRRHRAREPFPLRAARAIPGRHPAGHYRLRP